MKYETLMAVLFLVIPGCGRVTDPLPNLVSVSGTVSYDGKPLEQGDVKFVPKDPINGDAAIGTIRNGAFHMVTTVSSPGVRVGTYTVAITSYDMDSESARKMPLPGENVKVLPALIPEKYGNPLTSGFVVEVVPGMKSLRYDLQSDGRPGSDSSR
ncbi:hypothetical protein SH661x_002769 [Planctomicrobium sp. SH661]|uniref:hypothetical protein n=1 Tax=Planctomicrobium sp. SH661 TaxID=3448124 RepID=UPI003F5B997A